MPHKTYRFRCRCFNYVYWRAVDTCECCGQRGIYDGWGKSLLEAMGTRPPWTGLPPRGPHERLFRSALRACEACAGRGVLDVNQGETYVNCPSCGRTGQVIDYSPAELARLRQVAWGLLWSERVLARLGCAPHAVPSHN